MNTEQLKQAAIKATPGPVAFRTRYRSEPGMIGHYPWTYAGIERDKNRRPQYDYEVLYSEAYVLALLECVDALRMAVQQNDHDMLMTGEELRQCRAALQKLEAMP